MTTVSVRGLAMQYGRRLVFRELSFDLGAGQAAGVVGANGSGKTTLLRESQDVSRPTPARFASTASRLAMRCRERV